MWDKGAWKNRLLPHPQPRRATLYEKPFAGGINFHINFNYVQYMDTNTGTCACRDHLTDLTGGVRKWRCRYGIYLVYPAHPLDCAIDFSIATGLEARRNGT